MAAMTPNKTPVQTVAQTKTSLNFLLNLSITLAIPIEQIQPTIVEANPIHPVVTWIYCKMYKYKKIQKKRINSVLQTSELYVVVG